jgi:hypothetical protein
MSLFIIKNMNLDNSSHELNYQWKILKEQNTLLLFKVLVFTNFGLSLTNKEQKMKGKFLKISAFNGY